MRQLQSGIGSRKFAVKIETKPSTSNLQLLTYSLNFFRCREKNTTKWIWLLLTKNCSPISRILSFRRSRSSVIYLRLTSQLACSCLPFVALPALPFDYAQGAAVKHWSSNLNPRCTWHFNPQGLSQRLITQPMRALLPHIFTLTHLQ